jgi:parallel beta helix pectate lyase-like protein
MGFSALIPVLGWTQISVSPADNIQVAVDLNPPGTTFIVSTGTYRLQSVKPKDGDTFVGMPGAVLSGAQVLTQFSREGALWVASNQTQQGQLNGYCDAQHARCMYPEDLYFDNNPLVHVGDISLVGPGTWFFDYPNHKIYFADDPTGHDVETSVARSAFWGPANAVTIEGLTIEKYAIPAQFGAIGDQYPGPNWLVMDNEVRWNHGAGIYLSDGSQALNNRVHHNGQKGIGGSGQNLVIQGNEIAFNNWAGFDAGWEGPRWTLENRP